MSQGPNARGRPSPDEVSADADLAPRLKILVVEDEAVSAMYLDDVLSGLGYEVVASADTATLAVAAAEAHRPDLVLMDIHLKEGDGVEAAAEIRTRLGIPSILVTAYSDAVTLERIAAARPLDYLVKPVGLSALQEALEKAKLRLADEGPGEPAGGVPED